MFLLSTNAAMFTGLWSILLYINTKQAALLVIRNSLLSDFFLENGFFQFQKPQIYFSHSPTNLVFDI